MERKHGAWRKGRITLPCGEGPRSGRAEVRVFPACTCAERTLWPARVTGRYVAPLLPTSHPIHENGIHQLGTFGLRVMAILFKEDVLNIREPVD